MSILNQTHEQIHGRLFGISSLNDAKRQAVSKAIQSMNAKGDFFPESMHRNMKALEQSGTLTQFERHAIMKEFFPGHF